MLIPVILSGGSGNRLWPLSRDIYPKQLLNLVGEKTLLQQTALRAAQLSQTTAPLIICNQAHRFMVAEQLAAIDMHPANILLEPVGKNTAPAIAIAALEAMRIDKEALLLVLPADHLMNDHKVFQAAVDQALTIANQDYLVTFGVQPTHPETAYGYIEAGAPLSDAASSIAQFVEKPDLEKAKTYIADPNYLWNSGMFLMRARVYLNELATQAPAMLTACEQAFLSRQQDLDFTVVDPAAFAACPKDSIDYAVMEKTQRAAVVPLAARWNDLGAWSSLWEVGQRDEQGNVTVGDVLIEDVKNSYIRAQDRLVAAVGVEDHIVVETADAVLVAPLSKAQAVKNIVAQLKQQQRSEAQTHRRVYRPWGYYESLQQGPGFQVKRIVVNSGAKLSLQLHHHRSEHWVIIAGVADVIKGEESFQLQANQSTYIPQGTRHRLANQQQEPLVMIEVQTGTYLGEDDIVRFADEYARV